jgi:hypothetical protein
MCSDFSPSECVTCNVDEDCPTGAYCHQHECYRCDDGISNGDEYFVDCGGHCPTCLAFPCKADADCQSGFCAPDGICCTAPCDQVCTFCDFDGDCKDIDQYKTDPVPPCVGGMVCDGGGGCRLDNGLTCTSNVDCASFKCVNKTCVP